MDSKDMDNMKTRKREKGEKLLQYMNDVFPDKSAVELFMMEGFRDLLNIKGDEDTLREGTILAVAEKGQTDLDALKETQKDNPNKKDIIVGSWVGVKDNDGVTDNPASGNLVDAKGDIVGTRDAPEDREIRGEETKDVDLDNPESKETKLEKVGVEQKGDVMLKGSLRMPMFKNKFISKLNFLTKRGYPLFFYNSGLMFDVSTPRKIDESRLDMIMKTQALYDGIYYDIQKMSGFETVRTEDSSMGFNLASLDINEVESIFRVEVKRFLNTLQNVGSISKTEKSVVSLMTPDELIISRRLHRINLDSYESYTDFFEFYGFLLPKNKTLIDLSGITRLYDMDVYKFPIMSNLNTYYEMVTNVFNNPMRDLVYNKFGKFDASKLPINTVAAIDYTSTFNRSSRVSKTTQSFDREVSNTMSVSNVSSIIDLFQSFVWYGISRVALDFTFDAESASVSLAIILLKILCPEDMFSSMDVNRMDNYLLRFYLGSRINNQYIWDERLASMGINNYLRQNFYQGAFPGGINADFFLSWGAPDTINIPAAQGRWYPAGRAVLFRNFMRIINNDIYTRCLKYQQLDNYLSSAPNSNWWRVTLAYDSGKVVDRALRIIFNIRYSQMQGFCYYLTPYLKKVGSSPLVIPGLVSGIVSNNEDSRVIVPIKSSTIISFFTYVTYLRQYPEPYTVSEVIGMFDVGRAFDDIAFNYFLIKRNYFSAEYSSSELIKKTLDMTNSKIAKDILSWYTLMGGVMSDLRIPDESEVPPWMRDKYDAAELFFYNNPGYYRVTEEGFYITVLMQADNGYLIEWVPSNDLQIIREYNSILELNDDVLSKRFDILISELYSFVAGTALTTRKAIKCNFQISFMEKFVEDFSADNSFFTMMDNGLTNLTMVNKELIWTKDEISKYRYYPLFERHPQIYVFDSIFTVKNEVRPVIDYVEPFIVRRLKIDVLTPENFVRDVYVI
jgi:hypothetical protein